jgi:UDP-N-acetylmuramoyl-tripeptide--D-alanyl-D-alanine ligase
VLGDMAELGESSMGAHLEIGALAGELQLDHVVAIGKNAIWTADAARAAGARDASAFTEFSVGLAAILHLIQPEDVVLVKASRSSKMERVAEALRKAPAGFAPGTALAA